MRRYSHIRIFCLTLVFALVLSGTAYAAGIKANGNDKQLYALYAQIQAQLQLIQLRQSAVYNMTPIYDDIERNPSAHKNEKIYFAGTIVQVLEGSGLSEYRIAMNGDSDKVFLLDYERPENSERFLVDDKVYVYATFKELQTYSSTTNLSVTVPYGRANLIIRAVTDKAVLAASQEELEEALPVVLEALKKKMPKDHEYIKLTKANYDVFARQESLFKGDQITVTGKVLQVLEDTLLNTIRLAVDSDSDKVLYLVVDPSLCTIRVLEDDIIIVKGKYTGLYTYSSIRGGNITIPAAAAETLDLKGYKAPGRIPKDKAGNSIVSKKVFEDYARRPNEHLNESISFSAKVLQVIEGDTTSAYRMAVDSNSDYVFYVEIANSDRSMRVLEDDKVNVVGTFTGLMSYESTLGATITVPQCTASSIVIPGQKAAASQQDADGVIKITKKNYETIAREGDANKDKPVSFKAEVVQVVENDDMTIYRLAVDKSYDAMVLGVISNDDLSFRILEDDIITVEGTSTGLYSYSSTMGGKITIPSCLITKYSVEGYKPIDLGSPDAEGFLRITKTNYSEIARNPDPYKFKQMKFKAKIIQVVERSGGENVYRATVDSNSDCVFYIEYTLPSGSPRILEKDVVTITGTYYGIFSYETTMGSVVSVPALIADKISK